jgi:DNA-binding transcriptional LysR family regulator
MITITQMDIDDVRTFVAVVEAGSVSRAAAELNLTQPAVTRRVQRLEGVVGAPLLDRRRRPFSLTQIGRSAVERCRRLLWTAKELRGLALDTQVPSGEIRVGVAHALTELAFSQPVDEVRRAFPQVVLRLRTGWSRELLERVRSGALDAAAILLPEGEGLPSGVSGEAIGREHLALVAGRQWRSRTRAPRDLRGSGWVLNPEGCAARAALQRQLARSGLPLQVNVETYNYELQLSLIVRGRGLGLVPARLLARSRMRSRLRVLRVRGLDFPLTIWLTSGGIPAPLQPPLRALSRALAKRLGGPRVSREARVPLSEGRTGWRRS